MSSPSVPGVSEILTVIFLLVPGFASFVLIKKTGVLEGKFSDFEATILSLILSLIIYVPFSFITGLKDLESISKSLIDPYYISILLLIAGGLGLGLGFLIKIISKRAGGGTLWYNSIKSMGEIGEYVLVLTENGKEYKGFIKYSFEDPNTKEKELILYKPSEILRESCSGKVSKEKPMGQGILFLHNDIKRMIFLEKPPTTKKKETS